MRVNKLCYRVLLAGWVWVVFAVYDDMEPRCILGARALYPVCVYAHVQELVLTFMQELSYISSYTLYYVRFYDTPFVLLLARSRLLSCGDWSPRDGRIQCKSTGRSRNHNWLKSLGTTDITKHAGFRGRRIALATTSFPTGRSCRWPIVLTTLYV